MKNSTSPMALSVALMTTAVIVHAAPSLQISQSGASVHLSWVAPPGNHYTVLGATSVTGPWTSFANLTATGNAAIWSDTNLLATNARFFRVLDNGPLTNVLANVDALPQQVLATGFDANQVGANAVFLASQFQGGVQLVTNGTLVQGLLSWTYEPTPSDQLIVQFANTNSLNYRIYTMRGDFTGDAANFLNQSFEFSYRLFSSNRFDVTFASVRQPGGCNFTATVQGTYFAGAFPYAIDLVAGGRYCSTSGGGYAELLDDHTTTGTITAPGFNLAVNQRHYFYLISGNNQDGTTMEDWVNSTLTLGPDTYQWANAYRHKSFTNGRPAHFDPSGADVEWKATGGVLRNEAPYATYQYEFSPFDLFLRFVIALPTGNALLESFRK